MKAMISYSVAPYTTLHDFNFR